MKLLKSTLMASALILGSASASFAQDAITDKAKDMAVDKAKDMAKDEAKKHMGKTGEHAVNAGEHMMKGDSAKDAAMKVGKSEAKSQVKNMAKDKIMGEGASMATTSMDGDDMMTAGKVMMKGGSKEDAAMAVAKNKAKDAVMGKAEGMVKDQMMHQGTIKAAAPTVTAPTVTAPAAVTVNCPAGTAAQANGTCMITGDYQPGS